MSELESGQRQLPNGYILCWKKNEVGGRTYTSDEIGGGVNVWDTALVDQSTLLATLTVESELARIEAINNPVRRMHSCDIPGCASCGNPEEPWDDEA